MRQHSADDARAQPKSQKGIAPRARETDKRGERDIEAIFWPLRAARDLRGFARPGQNPGIWLRRSVLGGSRSDNSVAKSNRRMSAARNERGEKVEKRLFEGRVGRDRLMVPLPARVHKRDQIVFQSVFPVVGIIRWDHRRQPTNGG